MDRSIQYTKVMSNFDSAYNTGASLVHNPTRYMPISSSASFSSQQTRSYPKFNLDLYNSNEYSSESFNYSPPSSPVIVHHHPVHSPPPSQAISKLRQINDELCHTLAQCDLNNQFQESQPQSNYNIYHHPISRETSRSPSPRKRASSSSSSPSSIESEQPISRKRNARITYKAHIPRRTNPLPKVDQLLLSTSDAYVRDDPMTIDVYPTRDQGFIKKIRNRPDNQSPWLADTSPIRRNSYSETNTYQTPRAPYYDDKPIQPNSRLASGQYLLSKSKRRARSSSVKSRIRPDTAPNLFRQSAVSSSSIGPVWRPSGSIKRRKFIGSHDPPSKSKPPPSEPTWNPAGTTTKTKPFRAFDPASKSMSKKIDEPIWNPAGTTTKTKPFRALDPASKSISKKIDEPIWNPASKTRLEKPPKYFEPTVKPELNAPIRKETAPVVRKKPTMNTADPKLKTRIANAESKVKSAWNEPTTTITKPKPPIVPRPIKQPTIPPKTKVKAVPTPPIVPIKKLTSPAPPIDADTGRSSLNDVPIKPMFQSTPRNQSINHDADDLFAEESQLSEPPKTPEISHPPPQIEKTPTKLQPDKDAKSTTKDNIFVDNRTHSPEVNNKDNDEEENEPLKDHSASPSPIPPGRKPSSPKPDNRDDASVIDDEDFEPADDNSAVDDVISPSIPKTNIKTPPHQKDSSILSQSPDEISNSSPVDSKKKDQRLPSTPPPPTTTTTTDHAVDDFFD